MIVENRTGAGGAIAAHYVAGSPADGYTLLSVTSAHVVLPAINAPLQYDTLKDFASITMTSLAPVWLLVSPSLGVKSLGDFVALAKEKPNQLNYGFGRRRQPNAFCCRDVQRCGGNSGPAYSL